MQLDLALVFVHLLACIFLAGYGLFWFIVSLPGGARRDLLECLRRAPWPPRGLPVPVRLPLPGLAWGALAVLIASGVWLSIRYGDLAASHEQATSPAEAIFRAKTWLVGALAVVLLITSFRSRPLWSSLFLGVLLTIVALSAVLAR